MKSVVRMFALLVAVAGLVSASFAPATTQPPTKHAALTANGPGPDDLPGPPPCTLDDSCVAQTASAR
jgi:hypothetical protein